MKRLLVTLALTTAASACFIGKSAKDLPFATRPTGAPVAVATASQRATGELVAVRNDGIVLSARKQIMFVSFDSVVRFNVVSLDKSYSLGLRERPSVDKLARLRLVSQFPQGMTPGIERALLASAGQSAMITLQ